MKGEGCLQFGGTFHVSFLLLIKAIFLGNRVRLPNKPKDQAMYICIYNPFILLLKVTLTIKTSSPKSQILNTYLKGANT